MSRHKIGRRSVAVSPAAYQNVLGSFFKIQGWTPPWRLRGTGLEVDLASVGLKGPWFDSQAQRRRETIRPRPQGGQRREGGEERAS